LTITPTNDLDDRGSKIEFVRMASGVIKDVKNNDFDGISGSGYSFTVVDQTPPTITTSSPAHHALGVDKGTNIVLTFNENVAANTGNIVLRPSGGSGSNDDVAIPVGDTSQIGFVGNVMTINPANDLDDRSNKTFTVIALTGVVQDTTGNNFLLEADTYMFTNIDSTPPLLVSFNPVQGATTVLRTAPIVLTFNENMVAGSGNVSFIPSGGNDVNPTNEIAVTDSQVSIS